MNSIGLVDAQTRPRLSLCMIVRDCAEVLRDCLESVAPWVDEVIIVDTGSNDDTRDVASHYGARLFEFPWCDDFSAARNESLRHATGEWIFWMDSDDVLDVENGRKLEELVRGHHKPSTLGYVAQVHCPSDGSQGSSDATVVDHVKVFRNDPRIRFEGRIHEQVLMPIRRLGGEVEWTDIFVVHSNADHTDAGRERKYERDLRILEKDLQERPDHPFVLFNLGMTYADMQDYSHAANYLRRSLTVSDSNESHVRKTFALLVNALGELGESNEAWEACQQGRSLFPDDLELLFREAMLHHDAGRLDEAALAYERILLANPERHFTSVDRGIASFKTRYNLGVVFRDAGQLGRAEAQWRQVLTEVPNYRPAWNALFDLLLGQRRLTSAELVMEQMAELQECRCDAMLHQAELLTIAGNLSRARGVIENALHAYPASLDALHLKCRFLFEHGSSEEAEESLVEVNRRTPDDAAVLHNLGVVQAQSGKNSQALESLRESLRLRPDSQPTQAQLRQILNAT